MHKKIHLLVTAGPTREMLDPVRFLSNVSTGHLGYQIARQAKRMGFRVTLISGPTALKPPEGVRFVSVLSAREMKRSVFQFWPTTDALVMTAAVCDYTPVHFSRSKIKRIEQKTIKFKRTTDILEAVGKKKGRQVVVGFALETEQVRKNAMRKLKRKNLDFIVANWYDSRNNPFGDRRTSMVLLDRKGVRKRFQGMAKQDIAKSLLAEVLRFWNSKK
ncbi:MAG: phosphopantothenoylcysteine decarboxylase [Candidatus Omnitrophica bacterium]|nr:phosphopantothenoylcysteine decarboxylase [Candidatus Omnitrophota bacterium]